MRFARWSTRAFLDYFNLKALSDLPPLAEIKALVDPVVETLEEEIAPAQDPADGAEPAMPDAVGGDTGIEVELFSEESENEAPADEPAADESRGESVAEESETAESGPQLATVVKLPVAD